MASLRWVRHNQKEKEEKESEGGGLVALFKTEQFWELAKRVNFSSKSRPAWLLPLPTPEKPSPARACGPRISWQIVLRRLLLCWQEYFKEF